jgi:hypothetical protein
MTQTAKRVIVTQPMVGICHMQVCCAKDATDDEILDTCNSENPAGTSTGWAQVVRVDKEYPQFGAVQCKDDPERLHIMVAC